MAYTKRYAGGFVDGSGGGTPEDSTFLNAVESALLKLFGVDASADGQALLWKLGNSRYEPALIKNANIDPAAAIDKTKLASLAITNADIAAGAAIAASKLNLGTSLPGSEIGYDQITATVNVVSTVEATGTTIIPGSSHSFDGAPVIAEFFSPAVIPPAVAAQPVIICLFEGATEIARLSDSRDASAQAGVSQAVYARYRFSPSAGNHTYSILAFVASTTGTPSIGAGPGGTAADAPAYLRFTKV